MLIDAMHAEETRVVVLQDGRLEELDVDTSTKKQIKGNIYLAKVVRVEPSLQAAFIEYGGNRHGFLAFGEIHPDYYQIPVADRELLKELLAKEAKHEDDTDKALSSEKTDEVETVDESDTEETLRHKPSFLKKYKIQEVIRQGQVMLIQVVKEERGNKGAALTTYLSLAGRFSVLMPNNGRGGGVSRKITNAKDRKSLRDIVDKLPIPAGMSVIIRTAGQGKTKTEIKRDFDYLIKTWGQIRDLTLESIAPKLIHEEGDIVKRSLRDVFTPDIDEILVEGEDIFKSARAFMKLLLPSYAKKIKQYKGDIPLFLQYGVEEQLEAIHSNIVQLKSGGYLVIDQTEALVAVDVNSGRATREHDIEETALKTNLETCEELARQLKLRDLAGLVVIDFIDMDEAKNNAAVERALKEALKKDRARIQVGRISGFGLMEMSRQRLHSSFLEGAYRPCPHCGGKGIERRIESCAMHALHLLEATGLKNTDSTLVLTLPLDVASYLLNNKRGHIVALEQKYHLNIRIIGDSGCLKNSDFKLEKLRGEGDKIVLQVSNNDMPSRHKGERSDRVKSRNAQTGRGGARHESKKTELEDQSAGNELKETSEIRQPSLEPTLEDVRKPSGRAQKSREWRRRIREKKKAERKLSGPESGDETPKEIENFKVVTQEKLITFEEQKALPAVKTQALPEPEKPSQAEEKPKPVKKGWWNRFVS